MSSSCSGSGIVLSAHVRCVLPHLVHVHRVLCMSDCEGYVTRSGFGAALRRGRQAGHASSFGHVVSCSGFAVFAVPVAGVFGVRVFVFIGHLTVSVTALVLCARVSCVRMRVNLLIISCTGSAAVVSYGGWPLGVAVAVADTHTKSGGRPHVVVALACLLVLLPLRGCSLLLPARSLREKARACRRVVV